MDHSFTRGGYVSGPGRFAITKISGGRRAGISEIMEVLSNSDRAERDKAQFL